MTIAKETQEILAKGGFSVKCERRESKTRGQQDLFDSEISKHPDSKSEKQPVMLKRTHDNLRVLGFGWNLANDTIVFEVNLNFSPEKRGVRTRPNLLETDLSRALPVILTKRIVLEQVMKTSDPLGLVCPFT